MGHLRMGILKMTHLRDFQIGPLSATFPVSTAGVRRGLISIKDNDGISTADRQYTSSDRPRRLVGDAGTSPIRMGLRPNNYIQEGSRRR